MFYVDRSLDLASIRSRKITLKIHTSILSKYKVLAYRSASTYNGTPMYKYPPLYPSNLCTSLGFHAKIIKHNYNIKNKKYSNLNREQIHT